MQLKVNGKVVTAEEFFSITGIQIGLFFDNKHNNQKFPVSTFAESLNAAKLPKVDRLKA